MVFKLLRANAVIYQCKTEKLQLEEAVQAIQNVDTPLSGMDQETQVQLNKFRGLIHVEYMEERRDTNKSTD